MEHNTLDHHKVKGWMEPGEFGLSEEVSVIWRGLHPET